MIRKNQKNDVFFEKNFSEKHNEIKGFGECETLKDAIYPKLIKKTLKKELTKKRGFDNIYLVDGEKLSGEKDNENRRRRNKRQVKKKKLR